MDNIYFDLKRLKYLGVGAIVGKAVRIRRPEEVVIGDYTIIDDFTYISCPMEIGRYGHIAPHVAISGGGSKVTMGDFVGLSAGVSVHATSSAYVSASFELPSIPAELHYGGTAEDVHMGDHVLIGAKSTVLPGAKLPEGFASAAYTLIRKRRYEAWALYGGVEKTKKLCDRAHREALARAAELELVDKG